MEGAATSRDPGKRDSLWILDVDGYRLVIDGEHMPGATQAQINEITGMVKTLTFRTHKLTAQVPPGPAAVQRRPAVTGNLFHLNQNISPRAR